MASHLLAETARIIAPRDPAKKKNQRTWRVTASIVAKGSAGNSGELTPLEQKRIGEAAVRETAEHRVSTARRFGYTRRRNQTSLEVTTKGDHQMTKQKTIGRLILFSYCLVQAVWLTVAPATGQHLSKTEELDNTQITAAQNPPLRSAGGEVIFELIGQVANPSATSSIQFGYLPYVKGVETTFAPDATQNETTALFTFYNETTTLRVTNNGPLRIITREGTTTIYYNPTPSGDFSNPGSFRLGTPIQTSTLRHQVIINTVDSSFTTTFVNTVQEVTPFGERSLQLGKRGQQFRTQVFGRVNTPAPPAGYLAGYAVAIDDNPCFRLYCSLSRGCVMRACE
jgi:hypothetical protein